MASRDRVLFAVAVACLAVLSGEAAVASQTVVLQNGYLGYAGTTDAWLDDSSGARDDNYGGDQQLRIEYDDGWSDCAIIKFDLTGQIPALQRILSAQMSLYYSAAGSMQDDNAVTIKPYRVKAGKSWYENDGIGRDDEGVNLMYRDHYETLAWTGERAWYDVTDDGNGTNKIKETGGSVPDAIEPGRWVPFNVKNSVTNWYGGTENNGLLLLTTGFQGSGYTAYGLFASRNDTCSSPNYKPKLAITYEGAAAPIGDADGPYVVDVGGSVLFDGTGSYDPDGGGIVSWLWDLDDDGTYGDVVGSTVSLGYESLFNLLGLGEHDIGLKVVDDEGDWAIAPQTALTILPEPATMALLAVGLGACAARRGRR